MQRGISELVSFYSIRCREQILEIIPFLANDHSCAKNTSILVGMVAPFGTVCNRSLQRFSCVASRDHSIECSVVLFCTVLRPQTVSRCVRPRCVADSRRWDNTSLLVAGRSNRAENEQERLDHYSSDEERSRDFGESMVSSYANRYTVDSVTPDRDVAKAYAISSKKARRSSEYPNRPSRLVAVVSRSHR